jgi:hypothetical protein
MIQEVQESPPLLLVVPEALVPREVRQCQAWMSFQQVLQVPLQEVQVLREAQRCQTSKQMHQVLLLPSQALVA